MYSARQLALVTLKVQLVRQICYVNLKLRDKFVPVQAKCKVPRAIKLGSGILVHVHVGS